MPRVVPSQLLDFINNVHRGHSGQLSGMIDLLDQIPPELLTIDPADYARLICAKAHIRQKLLTWVADQRMGHDLGPLPGNPSQNAVDVIRDVLSRCPDESPSLATSELAFISDLDHRRNLRNDIGAITRALSNGEWKAATVLAGSTVEAILLWDLQRRPATDVTRAVAALVANGTFTHQPPSSLDQWVLHHYLEVAATLGMIKADTANEVRLAKSFRNLIHPGRSQRLGQECDRGTALSCVAVLEHVVRDLS